MQLPDFTGGLAGGALIAAVVAGWSQVKGFGYRIFGLFVVTVKVEAGQAGSALAQYLFMHFDRLPNGERDFKAQHLYQRPHARYGHVGFEGLGGQSIFFRQGWRFIAAHFAAGPQGVHDSYSIRFLRWTFDPEKLFCDALEEADEFTRAGGTGSAERFGVSRVAGLGSARKYGGKDSPVGVPGALAASGGPPGPASRIGLRMLRYTQEDIGVPKEPGALDRMALTPELLSAIEEVQHWRDSKEWYQSRFIPWRRGILFHGKPGTGKSSMVRSIAQDLDLPIISFDLGSMSNGEFTNAWSNLQDCAPCICLFEDFDTIFHGRDNCVNKEDGLTFDCLLNAISGVGKADGVLLIVTTNDLSKIDEAIGLPVDGKSSRPGRIDRVFECANPDEAGRMKIAHRILADAPELIEATVAAGGTDTGAQFQERCSALALAKHWESKA